MREEKEKNCDAKQSKIVLFQLYTQYRVLYCVIMKERKKKIVLTFTIHPEKEMSGDFVWVHFAAKKEKSFI